MKLKGTCKITLKNAKTGEIEHQEEHTNTITPALLNILQTNLSGTVDYNQLFPIFNKLLGGVCCWNGTVDATKFFLPKQENATLTAHAGLRAYSDPADDRSRGLLNSSQLLTNGYKWKWEWGTTQGNGYITDLTLVHADVGDFYEQSYDALDFCPVDDISNYIVNASEFQNNSEVYPTSQSLPQLVGNAQQKRMPIGFYGDLNHVVSIELIEDEQYESEYGGDWRRGHVSVYISKFAGTGAYLWNEVAEPDYERKVDVSNVVWQQANQDFKRANFYVAYDEEIKHLYIMWGGSRSDSQWDPPLPSPPYTFTYYSVGSTLHYCDVNLETGTSTVKYVYANSGQLMFRFPNQNYIPIQVQVVDGHIIMPLFYVPSNEQGKSQYQSVDDVATCGIRLDLRTATVKDYVEDLSIAYGENTYNGTVNINLGNSRSMYLRHYVEKKESKDVILSNKDSWYYAKIMDFPEFFPNAIHTGRMFTASSANSLIQFAIAAGGGVLDWNKRIRGALLNKMYQASVFHLDVRVTKTNSHIMAVEYTLTQEENENE